jgi:ABC-type transport system involved in multi-copper enzyme maturation permease subunit
MIKCGGCGRDIDLDGIGDGSKYLCVRCYHQQVAERVSPGGPSHTAFIAVAAVSLAVIALAGITLCILYLLGAGNIAWFITFLLLMLCVVACPAVVLLRMRNVSLLITSLYLPLGLWSYLWYVAPGVDWDYGRLTAWGAYAFAFIGLLAVFYFLRDLRTLPRL